MMFVIGLGNPGKKFERTRHNIGFRLIDELSKENNFPAFKTAKKFLAEISEGNIDGKKIILAKPQTFMNQSGKSVAILNIKYNIKDINLLVIHDDIDLPLGKIRISAGRGAAGHKGVESIIKELETKEFVRFRIGIKPQNAQDSKHKTQKFVLEKFNKNEEKILKETIEKTINAIEITIKEGTEKAMAKFN